MSESKPSNAPTWISAGAALVVTIIAVLSLAASPSEQRLDTQADMLDDHEERIRAVEHLTAQELSAINATLQGIQDDLRERE